MSIHEHSFVIPAYKQSPYLEECIAHLLNQTVQSAIILTTSTPSSFLEQLAAKYNLPYFVNNESPGIASDWNFALSKATTPYVTIAHQDDLYDAKFTATVLSAIKEAQQEKVLLVFTNYHDVVNGEQRKFSVNALVKQLMLFPFVFTKRLSNRFFKKAILSGGDPICCPSVTLHKNNIGNFSFSTELSCVLDWDAWYQLAQQEGAFVYIDQKLMSHRIHKASETAVQISNGRRQQEELMMFEKIWGKPVARLLSGIYRLGHKENM